MLFSDHRRKAEDVGPCCSKPKSQRRMGERTQTSEEKAGGIRPVHATRLVSFLCDTEKVVPKNKVVFFTCQNLQNLKFLATCTTFVVNCCWFAF